MKENKKLKREVKNLVAKVERCYNSKVTFEQILMSRPPFLKVINLPYLRQDHAQIRLISNELRYVCMDKIY